MHKELFQPGFPGNLVEVDSRDIAFIPDPLPPTNWSFPNRLLPVIGNARALLGKLDGMAYLLPDPDLFLRPLQRREAFRSSSLEGTFATPEELLLFELDQNRSAEAPASADAG